MALDDIKSRRGFPKKEVTCDECKTTEVVSAERGRAGEGQARSKLQKNGWTSIGGVDRCPSCETKRKGIPEMNQQNKITADTPLREPSRAQKRGIVEMLDAVYDIEAGRYKGNETDLSVAQTLEDGILPGWVAQLREEFFGPDGGNNEIEELHKELREQLALLEKKAADLHQGIQDQLKELRELNQGRESAANLLKRVEKIRAAVGPKAERI